MSLYFSLLGFCFLLVFVMLYWAIGGELKQRKVILTSFSLLGMFLISPYLMFVMIIASFLVWAFGKSILSGGEKRQGYALIGSLLFLVFAWTFLKYGGEALSKLYPESPTQMILMPLGISYFTFRSIQFLIDVYRGVITQFSLLQVFTFLCFLPIIPAGPIESFQGFFNDENQKTMVQFDRSLFNEGVYRIVEGLFKKVFILSLFLDRHMAPVREAIFNLDGDLAFSKILAFGPMMFVYAYIDLSAYSDLAIGFSRLFGIRVMENFEAPMLQKNLADFWRSWHMSLSNWCRNNVFFPVFGFTRSSALGLYLCMLTMGLWHHVNLNWTFWAIYHGSGLVALAYWDRLKRKNKPLKKFLKRPRWTYATWMATLIYVSFGYLLVGTKTWDYASRVIGIVWPLWLSFIVVLVGILIGLHFWFNRENQAVTLKKSKSSL